MCQLHLLHQFEAMKTKVKNTLLGGSDQPSTEHSLGLQLIEAIARAQPGSVAVGSTPPTTTSLCQRLAPYLAADWIWWISERPQLISAIARSLYDTDEASLLQQFGNAFVPLHAWTVHALHVGFAQEARLRPSPATGSAALSEAADCVLRVRRAIAYIKNTLAMPIPFIYFHTLNLIMYSMYTIFAFAFTSLKVRLRPDDVLARDTDSAVPCSR